MSKLGGGGGGGGKANRLYFSSFGLCKPFCSLWVRATSNTPGHLAFEIKKLHFGLCTLLSGVGLYGSINWLIAEPNNEY